MNKWEITQRYIFHLLNCHQRDKKLTRTGFHHAFSSDLSVFSSAFLLSFFSDSIHLSRSSGLLQSHIDVFPEMLSWSLKECFCVDVDWPTENKCNCLQNRLIVPCSIDFSCIVCNCMQLYETTNHLITPCHLYWLPCTLSPQFFLSRPLKWQITCNTIELNEHKLTYNEHILIF